MGLYLVHIHRMLSGFIERSIMNIWEIKPHLFQSPQIDNPIVLGTHDITCVIDLSGLFDKKVDWWAALLTATYLYWPIYDLTVMPNERVLWNVAGYAYRAWQSGDKVLVHCTMGHNRSGLMTGMILHLDGMKGVDAVKLIQEKVPGALSNPVFRAYLEGLKGVHI